MIPYTADKYELTPDLKIDRILNGLWQLSGAHGAIDQKQAVNEMFSYVDAGFNTWDLADHYGPAEDLVGEFRRQLRATRDEAALQQQLFFTKWVPRPGLMTQRLVQQSIDRSRRRMDMETLDLLQFHWWDYQDQNYINALKMLAELCQEQQIRHLALTNFDTTRLEEITNHGIKIVSNQVQFSLVDMRPEVSMSRFCHEHNIGLLTYGTLCGGLISEKYLGVAEPSNDQLDTASLRKYKRMIDGWGGWSLLQELLRTLQEIADKHKVSIANVAVRYILNRTAVAGVIIGARLSIAQHIDDNRRVFGLNLDSEDNLAIARILDKARNLYKLIGDCGDEYR